MHGCPITFLFLAVCCSKSIKPTNHFSTLFINNLCKIEYIVLHRIFRLHGRPIIFYVITGLFYVIKEAERSKNHPLLFVYYLLCMKWNFVLPWEIVVQPKPDQLDYLLRPCESHMWWTCKINHVGAQHHFLIKLSKLSQ